MVVVVLVYSLAGFLLLLFKLLKGDESGRFDVIIVVVNVVALL